jgi:hypothetical protein
VRSEARLRTFELLLPLAGTLGVRSDAHLRAFEYLLPLASASACAVRAT